METKSKKDKTLKQRANAKMALLPAVDEIASPNYPELKECFMYTMTELKWLEEYKKDLDPYRAGKAVQVTRGMVNKYLKQDKIIQVLSKIHEAYVDAVQMDTKVAAGRFIGILDKMEKRFDSGDEKVASALANMAGNYLRATGHFGAEAQSKTPQVQINIDLGNPPATDEPIIINQPTTDIQNDKK